MNMVATAGMFLRIKHNEDTILVEVLDLKQLCDPFCSEVLGRIHAGEELQDQAMHAKTDLQFPSGEPLPLCWLDASYLNRNRIAASMETLEGRLS